MFFSCSKNRTFYKYNKNPVSRKFIKFHLQLKISEAFDTCIKSMNSLSLSATDEERLIQLIQQSSNTIKDAFVHIGGNLAELPNQIRDTLAIEMIQIMKW